MVNKQFKKNSYKDYLNFETPEYKEMKKILKRLRRKVF